MSQTELSREADFRPYEKKGRGQVYDSITRAFKPNDFSRSIVQDVDEQKKVAAH
jgi:hypothetical protein